MGMMMEGGPEQKGNVRGYPAVLVKQSLQVIKDLMGERCKTEWKWEKEIENGRNGNRRRRQSPPRKSSV